MTSGTRFALRTVVCLTAVAVLITGIWATSTNGSASEAANIDPYPMSVDLDRGAPGLSRCLAAIRTRASILMVVTHPDDEDGGLLAYQSRGLGARATLLTLNRGEGGQNVMSM